MHEEEASRLQAAQAYTARFRCAMFGFDMLGVSWSYRSRRLFVACCLLLAAGTPHARSARLQECEKKRKKKNR